MPPISLERPLSDGTVTVRRWAQTDVDALVSALQDPEVSRWTTIPRPYTKKEARAFLRANTRQESLGMGTDLPITDSTSDELIGGVGLRFRATAGVGEIGYWVIGHRRRQGVASRAVTLVAAWTFENHAVGRLELLTRIDNVASERVAQRCGFTREGVLRSYRVLHGERMDMTMFSLLPTDLTDLADHGSTDTG